MGYSYAAVTGCYNTGDITTTGSNSYAGGVAGSSFSTVAVCYNSGTVSNKGEYNGGVVAANGSAGTLSYCYYDITKNSELSGIGVDGNINNSQGSNATGFSTTYMQSGDFVTSLNNNAYTYNTTATTQTCAWVDNSPNGYPTLNFGVEPTYTIQ